jgi:hypothetical protein
MVVVTSAHANHSSLVPVSIQPAEAHDVDMNTNFITTLASSCFLLPSADILFHLLSLPPPKTPKGNYTFGLALANTTNSRHMPPKPNPKPNAAGGGVVPTIDKDGRPLPSRDVMRARFAQTVYGAIGEDGAHQGNGVTGENGANGANGAIRVNRANGTHQPSGTNGANMANGANRTNGANPTHQSNPSNQPNQTNPPPNPQEPKLFLRIRGLSDDKNKKNDNKEKETNKNDTRSQETQSASASASSGTVAPGGEAPSSPSTSSSSSSSSSDSQATISAHSSSSSSESASPPQITNVNINNNVWNAAGYSTQDAREEHPTPQVQDYGVHLLAQAARYVEGRWDGDEDARRAAGILVGMRHDYR